MQGKKQVKPATMPAPLPVVLAGVRDAAQGRGKLLTLAGASSPAESDNA